MRQECVQIAHRCLHGNVAAIGATSNHLKYRSACERVLVVNQITTDTTEIKSISGRLWDDVGNKKVHLIKNELTFGFIKNLVLHVGKFMIPAIGSHPVCNRSRLGGICDLIRSSHQP